MKRSRSTARKPAASTHSLNRRLESLEDRTVPASLSIGDASATEGGAAIRLVDDFVAPNAYGLAAARNIQVGPDGNVYVASHDTNDVKVFEGNTGRYLGALTTPGGELVGPWGMVFGPDARLYVGGRYSHDIVRFDISNDTYDVFVAANSGLGSPRGLAFGPDGNLYASSHIDGASGTTDTVKKYDGATGAYLGDFVTAGSGGLNDANGVAFGPDGNFYVASNETEQVKRYSGATGAFIDNFVSAGSGGIGDARQIAFPGDGYVYLTDANSSTNIYRYSATTGAFVGVFAVGPTGTAPIGSGGLAFAPSGVLYVSDGGPTGVTGSFVTRFAPMSVAAFTISLDAASSSPVSVNFATTDGTATAGSDYVPTSGTVTFAPGETTRTILVPTIDDTIPEPTESFTVNFSNPVGATITTAQGVGTIFDNDPVQVAKVAINGGTAQRSEVRSLSVTFTGQVTLPANPANAFQLQNVTDGNNVASAASVATDGLGRTIVTLTFSGPETDPVSAENSGVPSLADGRYSLTIAAASVIGSDGLALDGAGTGTAGSNYVSPTDTRGGGPGQLGLYRLFGDTNGDGIVDQLDLGQFRSANNSSAGNPSYLADLDADNSGSIDQFDLAQFRQRNNSSVFPMTPGGTPMPVPAPIPSPNFFPGPIVAAPPVAASPGESIAADGIEADSVVRRGLLTITGVSSIDWLTASAALKHKSGIYADWLANGGGSDE